jgi:hypothetical protein
MKEADFINFDLGKGNLSRTTPLVEILKTYKVWFQPKTTVVS